MDGSRCFFFWQRATLQPSAVAVLFISSSGRATTRHGQPIFQMGKLRPRDPPAQTVAKGHTQDVDPGPRTPGQDGGGRECVGPEIHRPPQLCKRHNWPKKRKPRDENRKTTQTDSLFTIEGALLGVDYEMLVF